MFNPTALVIDAFVEKMKETYLRTYGILEPDFPDMIAFVGRMALEKIANSDAPYHDLHHTIMVTEVGQEILKGKHILEGGVKPRDWMHFMLSCLCHDIGYVRGACRGDRAGQYVIDGEGNTVTLPAGATDASLTPYHVARSKLFVEQRFGAVRLIDTEVVLANIEHTRFPVPDAEEYRDIRGFPGLMRAADFIGQIADINYARKSAALFAEFQETGVAQKLGYAHAGDLRKDYPEFFWRIVSPLIQEALRFLKETQEGKYWLAGLYANVFAEEHNIVMLGAERGCP